MDCLFLLSGEHLPLARAECQSRNQAKKWQALPGALRGDVDDPTYETLAFTKATYDIIIAAPPEKTKKLLAQTTHKAKETIKIERVRIGRGNAPSGEETRRLLIPWLGRPPIDLTHPERVFALIATEDEWLVAERRWVNEEDFEARKNQRRPAPHPTGMHPKLARAMVNLARPEREVLDPFCGGGGILIEAGLIGLSCTGTDIDHSMAERARKNLERYGVEANVHVQDALDNEDPAETIVTDLPYGRNSKAEDLVTLYKGFLERAKTKRMVIGFPSLVDPRALAEAAGWTVLHEFTWRLHKSLIKHVLVLEKQFSPRAPPMTSGRATPTRSRGPQGRRNPASGHGPRATRQPRP